MKQNHSQQELRHHRLNTVDPIRFGRRLAHSNERSGVRCSVTEELVADN